RDRNVTGVQTCALPIFNKWGHQFRQDVRISEIERTLHASYDIPIENVIRDRLSFTGELSNQKFGDITSNYARLGVVRDTGWKLRSEERRVGKECVERRE